MGSLKIKPSAFCCTEGPISESPDISATITHKESEVDFAPLGGEIGAATDRRMKMPTDLVDKFGGDYLKKQLPAEDVETYNPSRQKVTRIEAITGIVVSIEPKDNVAIIELAKSGGRFYRQIPVDHLKAIADGRDIALGDGVAILTQYKTNQVVTHFRYYGQATYKLGKADIEKLQNISTRAKDKSG